MITGAHFLLYTSDADADRAFIRDILGFPGIDVGGGWLIFKVPPAEMAVHPAGETFAQDHAGKALAGAVLYLICDDLDRTMAELEQKAVSCGEVGKAEWGRFTSIPLPSGAHLGLYQPHHPTAI